MPCILGIDIGSSTTKAVLFKEGKLIGSQRVTASDNVASAYGAFGKLLKECAVSTGEVNKVILTGVGASSFKEGFFNYPTTFAGELRAIGLGGKYLTRLDKALVVNMGTGTAFIKVIGDEITHLGGSGVGGGSLLGLSKLLISTDNIDKLSKLIDKGDQAKIDLTLKDVSSELIEGLSMDTTVANFGNISPEAQRQDVARGLINMVFQVIGMMAVFAAREDSIQEVVLAGNLATLKEGLFVFKDIESLHNVKFIIPDHAEYTTAIGAVMSAI